MIPQDSPVSRALLATPKAVENERRILKRVTPIRVHEACNAIDKVGDLAVYNPTTQQCESILVALRDAIARVEKQFATIAPRQVTFELE